MVEKLDSLISQYEEEFSQLDSQDWEQALPRVKNLKSTKKTRIKTDFIDVDLVRGSTFPKSKTRHGFCSLVSLSFLRLVMFPFKWRWWIQNTSQFIYFAGCYVYFGCIYNWGVALWYICSDEDSRYCDTISLLHDLLEPVILFAILVVLQCHIATPRKYNNKTRKKSVVDTLMFRSKTNFSGSNYEERLLSDECVDSRCEDMSGCSDLLDTWMRIFSSSKAKYKDSVLVAGDESCGETVSSGQESDQESLISEYRPGTPEKTNTRCLHQCISTQGRQGKSFCEGSCQMFTSCASPSCLCGTASRHSTSEPLTTSRASCSSSSSHTVTTCSPCVTSVSQSSTSSEVWSSPTSAQSSSTNGTCSSSVHQRAINNSISCSSSTSVLTPPSVTFSDFSESFLSNSEQENSTLDCSTLASKESCTSTESTCSNLCKNNQIPCGEKPSTCSDSQKHFVASACHVDNKIGCTVWNAGEPSKIRLSALEIGSAVFERSQETPDSNDYGVTGLCFAILLAILPVIFKLAEAMPQVEVSKDFLLNLDLSEIIPRLTSLDLNWLSGNIATLDYLWVVYIVVIVNSVIVRLLLVLALFFLLSVAERAFKRRFLTAKLFSHITSTRRSMKYGVPHFRLYKVRNIKAWLCVRSLLRRRGPHRSIDSIVSAAFIITLVNVFYLCFELLKDDNAPDFNIRNCEVICWCISLGIFLLRFMTLASRTNQKYRNLSVLITEQINLYLRMEEKPEKKEQLSLANNVLKLSSDLLKELETPFKIIGLSANPFLYNVTKVLVLSAVSGALSEMLGFKLKLYKVKLK